MSEAPRIFVSHSHEDDAFCQRLVSDLRLRLGDDAVWFDTSGGLHAGDDWWDTIVHEITARHFFLVVLSAHADQSNWVQREMRIGFRQHVEQGKRLLPIRISSSPRREDWADIHELDFTQCHDPAHYAAALTELWQVLGLESARAHTQATPEAAPTSADSPPATPTPVQRQHKGLGRFTLLSAYTQRGGVQSVAWSPSGAMLAICSDWETHVWESATGKDLKRLGGGHSAAWSPDGTRLATAGQGQGRLANIWDTSSWKQFGRTLSHRGNVFSVAWAPDGSRLATGTSGKACVWDVASAKPLVNLDMRWETECVAWAPDGRYLAIALGIPYPSLGVWNMSAHIWDLVHGVWTARLDMPTKTVFSVAWSPDGRRVATGSADNTVRIWDATNGQCVAGLEGHTGWVRSAVWSPDGAYIATGSDDTTVRIWDAASRRLLATLTGHMDRVNAVAWSPNGARLATASEDGTARVWGQE